MQKNPWFINTLLIGELLVLCLVVMIIRTYTPAAIFPKIDIPLLTLLSLFPFAAEARFGDPSRREPISSILIGGASFLLLPYAAGLDLDLSPWMLFTVSSAVFGMTMLFFCSITKRSHSAASLAANAFCLFLASQCFQGLI